MEWISQDESMARKKRRWRLPAVTRTERHQSQIDTQKAMPFVPERFKAKQLCGVRVTEEDAKRAEVRRRIERIMEDRELHRQTAEVFK
jgi:hypothetical protein